MVVMVLFIIELVLQSICKADFFLGFFFWLDFISSLSLLFDIGYLSDMIFQVGNSEGTQGLQIARAGRTSRVGTRAARIVRIVRLVKLYKHTKKMIDKKAAQIKAMKIQMNLEPQKEMSYEQERKMQEEEEQFFKQSDQE